MHQSIFQRAIMERQNKAATASWAANLWRNVSDMTDEARSCLRECELLSQVHARNAREMMGVKEIDQFYA